MSLLKIHSTLSLRRLSASFFLVVFLISGVISTLPVAVQSAQISYVENNSDSFVYYKEKLESALLDFESEFRLNKSVSDATISNIKSLIQEAFNRLPDSGDAGAANERLRKSAVLYLDLAAQNKTSSAHAQNAAGQVSQFLSSAEIGQIEASISANPTSGNAPLTTSFLATAKDPSGINIPDGNFVWWMRQAGGYRKELGRGPTLTYTFAKEGNYQVFLDILSESRNKKGRPDVTSRSVSQDIEVKPRLGNVILLINGVNVSNLETLKVSPTLGKIGLLFDATASRAVSNGTITKTKWDFGNGNVLEYDGPPILEKQLFTNVGSYKISLEITTNQGQSFKKQIQLLLRDPAAIISMDKEVGYIGEEIRMSSKSYLANTTNVEYSWEVQEADSGKKIVASKIGNTFSHKFQKVGQYIISLTTRSPNGNTDTDSQVLIIDSRPPSINLDPPRPVSVEKPNTILFDASRSYDADTKNTKGLTYTWTIDGQEIELNNIEKDGAVGTYTFQEKGNHTVSLTIANEYGKVSTIDKNISVASTLTIGMNISPRAAPIGSMISFQARSPQARFFEWNVGDGSPPINGTTDFIQHIYKRTGVYNATLTVKNADGSEQNTISRKIYITDTDSPFALVEIKNAKGAVQEEATACENKDGAFVINRADSTTVDGSNSINVDGNSSGLSYTWKYLDRVKTGPSFSEKFSELGCFPVELTVRSERTGKSHSSTRYVQIKNIAPKITSVDASIDTTKKDTQKLIVNVVANGARDEDGVITSYIWFYTTESDPEKQNIRITQTPSTTFILPNVTEKYYFGVIIEDNDGARYDSSESESERIPLLVANEDANMNIPLISLNVAKTQVLTDEVVNFSASAKNIIGTDITAKSEYFWDFDGDSKIDQKTSEPQASHKYKRSGKYNMKLKVVNNGVSNTKYQVIYVKNELKAEVIGYRIEDMLYLLNASKGSYENAKWLLGPTESTSLYGASIPYALLTEGQPIGNLTVGAGPNEASTLDITPDLIETLPPAQDGEILIQSSPKMDSGAIVVASPSDRILISMYGNKGVRDYAVDTDVKIDSDLDAVGDNDKDNKDTVSYTDGSIFAIDTSTTSKVRTREMKITLTGEDGKTIGTKIVKIIFDYVATGNSADTTDITGTGSEGFSESDKANLEKLQSKIRTLDPEDRIIFTQYYNNLIENWNDLHDRTEGLLLIQKEVNDNVNFDDAEKTQFSEIIDTILVGDAQAVNDISVASRVIEGLIPSGENRAYIVERLEQIKAQPGNLDQNKILGKEILEKVQGDESISTDNKILIKNQLLTIINGGQENVSAEAREEIAPDGTSGGGFLGFLSGSIKIFGIIIVIILGLFLLGFIIYRLTRRNSDMGFQDFLIDSIAHNKPKTPPKSSPSQNTDTTKGVVIPQEVKIPEPVVAKEEIDPLNNIGVYNDNTLSSETPKEETPFAPLPTSPASDPLALGEDLTSSPEETHTIPDWLKPVKTTIPETEVAKTSTEKEEEKKWIQDDSDLLIIKDGESASPIVGAPRETAVEETPLVEKEDDTITEGVTTEEVKNDLPDPLLDPLSSHDEDVLSPIMSDPLQDGASQKVESDLIITGEDASPIVSDVHGTDSIVLPTETPEQNTNTQDTEIIPDWLKISTDESPAEEDTSEKDTPEQENDEGVFLNPVPEGTDLPDWLKNSLSEKNETEDTEGKKTRSSPKKREKAPKQGVTAQSIKKEVPHEKKTSSSDDIPDWLK